MKVILENQPFFSLFLKLFLLPLIYLSEVPYSFFEYTDGPHLHSSAHFAVKPVWLNESFFPLFEVSLDG